MSDIAIKVENISKQYRLGTVGTGTLSHDLNRFWAKVRGKEDPYLQIGHVNDRTTKAESDYVWALKDINFEVKKGEILGIIGKNGAGKSTLLKILSRVTSPTTGSIKMNGRVGSLLEVGTGFHPELTGRENIFLNGAILGMRKWEIQKKLDEIVDFSGCEKYLDTPVKRYSSGMKVRLGFAVAAHLEPEILIVDEVLAVGDAEFQKKCIGKMQDVSRNYGRTILFVSHNLTAIQSLCSQSILLSNGEVNCISQTKDVIRKYWEIRESGFTKGGVISNLGRYFKHISLVDKANKVIDGNVNSNELIFLRIEMNSHLQISEKAELALSIYDEYDQLVFRSTSGQMYNIFIEEGYNYLVNVDLNSFSPGKYRMALHLHVFNKKGYGKFDIMGFEIKRNNSLSCNIDYFSTWNMKQFVNIGWKKIN